MSEKKKKINACFVCVCVRLKEKKNSINFLFYHVNGKPEHVSNKITKMNAILVFLLFIVQGVRTSLLNDFFYKKKKLPIW